jgi:hypothetical protein
MVDMMVDLKVGWLVVAMAVSMVDWMGYLSADMTVDM